MANEIDEPIGTFVVAESKPESGRIYSLTGLGPSIANGNSWSEADVTDSWFTIEDLGYLGGVMMHVHRGIRANDFHGSPRQALREVQMSEADVVNYLNNTYGLGGWEFAS